MYKLTRFDTSAFLFRALVLTASWFILDCSQLFGQKQLVFIRQGEVIARFTEGDNFKFKLKNGRKVDGFIVELSDYSMITSNDTIKYLSIGKIHGLSTGKFQAKVGRLLFIGGFGFVAIDRLNYALGYNTKEFNQADWIGLGAGAAGALLIFIKPKYNRLKPGTIVRAIDYNSPFYLLPK